MFGRRSGGIYSTKNQTGSQRLEEQTQNVHFPKKCPGIHTRRKLRTQKKVTDEKKSTGFQNGLRCDTKSCPIDSYCCKPVPKGLSSGRPAYFFLKVTEDFAQTAHPHVHIYNISISATCPHLQHRHICSIPTGTKCCKSRVSGEISIHSAFRDRQNDQRRETNACVTIPNQTYRINLMTRFLDPILGGLYPLPPQSYLP